MNYLSTFTGIGGFDLGLDGAGMNCIGQVEIDPHCRNVLRYHYPNIERKRDVQKVTGSTFHVPNLICGGFPCQDLSVAGKRKGLAGKRSGLFFEFARIVSVFKPKLFLLENVPGLLSSAEGRDFATMLRWMDELGYLQTWRVFDSQYFRVAQRRRRVFIIGSLGDGSCAEILFESESLCRNPSESRKEGQGPAGCLTDRPGASGSGWARYNETEHLVPDVAWALQERDCKGADSDTKEGHLIPVAYNVNTVDDSRSDRPNGGMYVNKTDKALTPSSKGKTLIINDRPNEFSFQENVSHGLRATDYKSPPICFQQNTRDKVREIRNKVAGSLSAEPGMKQQNYITTFKDVSRPCFSAMGTKWNGNEDIESSLIKSNYGVRRLTPRECERLQGFPDDWTRWGMTEDGKKIEISDTQRYKMLGNAITRWVSEWIGKRIKKLF